jgi:succinate dehydrogenase / fumarate reductase cytochrome b subunit
VGTLESIKPACQTIINVRIVDMKTDRPVNLNLLAFSFPLAALVSITHRVTGVILFVGVAFALYALDMALASPEGFAAAQALIAQPLSKFILLGLIAALEFHILAGLKHILMDFHLGDSVAAARYGSMVVIALTVISTAVIGAILW